MTVAQLIKKLQKLNQDMTVVVSSNDRSFKEDFVALRVTDLVLLKTRQVFKEPYFGNQLYDASFGTRERSTEVLSLTGGTYFQRVDSEEE